MLDAQRRKKRFSDRGIHRGQKLLREGAQDPLRAPAQHAAEVRQPAPPPSCPSCRRWCSSPSLRPTGAPARWPAGGARPPAGQTAGPVEPSEQPAYGSAARPGGAQRAAGRAVLPELRRVRPSSFAGRGDPELAPVLDGPQVLLVRPPDSERQPDRWSASSGPPVEGRGGRPARRMPPRCACSMTRSSSARWTASASAERGATGGRPFIQARDLTARGKPAGCAGYP